MLLLLQFHSSASWRRFHTRGHHSKQAGTRRELTVRNRDQMSSSHRHSQVGRTIGRSRRPPVSFDFLSTSEIGMLRREYSQDHKSESSQFSQHNIQSNKCKPRINNHHGGGKRNRVQKGRRCRVGTFNGFIGRALVQWRNNNPSQE